MNFKSFCNRLLISVVSLVLMFGAIASPALAFNPKQVDTLKSTKVCIRCDLAQAKLSGLDLSGADLTESDLNATDFSNTNLSRAKFVGAALQNTKLNNAKLDNADLSKAILLNTNLTGATVSESAFKCATVMNATMPNGKNFVQLTPSKECA